MLGSSSSLILPAEIMSMFCTLISTEDVGQFVVSFFDILFLLSGLNKLNRRYRITVHHQTLNFDATLIL